MVLQYHKGYDIVYGVRKERKTDTWFKKNTALAFYKVMEKMGTKTVYNHADFRLMSKRALEYLLQFKERNLFIRGVPLPSGPNQILLSWSLSANAFAERLQQRPAGGSTTRPEGVVIG